MDKNFKLSFTRSSNPPSKHDTAKQGTIWEATQDYTKIFIQASRDEKNPYWVRMGNFLETAFGDLFLDEPFINMAMELYHQQRRMKNK